MHFSEIISDNSTNPDLNIKTTNVMGITYTEGTTGPPKGVVYKHFLVLSGQIFEELIKQIVNLEKYDKVVYCPTPLFQSFSQLVVVFSSLFLDATIVIAERFNATTFWDDVRKYNAEIIFIMGAYYKI